MFCYQCEQTAKGKGCEKIGICGKDPEVAALQDLLIYTLKGLSQVALVAREKGINEKKVNVFMLEATFSTLTNVNFDANRVANLVKKCVELRDELKKKISERGGVAPENGPAGLKLASDLKGLVAQGEEHGILAEKDPDPDIHSLKQTLIYGLKGVAAYADHAQILGQEDDRIYKFIQEAFAATLRTDMDLGKWVEMVLECGRINLLTMELLDKGNTTTYGHPTPTKVPLGAKKGKAILVSGHDLRDLEIILKQTEGKGIYVYTHGEMLPCHGYPELKKYQHFYGHYGTAWQNQQKEFAKFPGAIIMTTNCIQKPLDNYKNNIFTTGLVAWPGITHIGEDKDFTPAIERALEMEGFKEDTDLGYVTVGFARNAILSVADKVIEGVKAGKIRHFFVVGGCDGAKPSRNYYTELVEKIPHDCLVLTLGCGKFKFFNKNLGEIDGIPRLLDLGQCNDAYSAIQIALALAKAFNCDVNELPLSLIISWYEQKAVAILLTLLSLGIKNIRLGPTLPAFITPNVLDFLVKNYDIKPISTPEEDLKAILG
ncbi:hydroxylamine reductase [Desulfonauticus submarinus]|uniref:Hydroxylamine reductase n=1 Tax=Desulfonauticus submarinus TaxID=206665 RepID=A0A1H0F893_9BACT|nr:hydroxylamine reductase [Desulfonauticus submarinus]SDN90927.1 hydroxylamine reductase [Desulfonauticus submarinus]